MKVEISLFAFLKEYRPDGQGLFSLVLEEGETVGLLMGRLAIPSEIQLITVVNGQAADSRHPLKDGDEIFIFSPTLGG